MSFCKRGRLAFSNISFLWMLVVILRNELKIDGVEHLLPQEIFHYCWLCRSSEFKMTEKVFIV